MLQGAQSSCCSRTAIITCTAAEKRRHEMNDPGKVTDRISSDTLLKVDGMDCAAPMVPQNTEIGSRRMAATLLSATTRNAQRRQLAATRHDNGAPQALRIFPCELHQLRRLPNALWHLGRRLHISRVL